MVKLSGLVVELLVDEHGIGETIRLFSNPIFFLIKRYGKPRPF
jgi:hypothetical protein